MTEPLDFRETLALQRRRGIQIDHNQLADDLVRKIIGDLVAADDRVTAPAPARMVKIVKRDETPPAETSTEQRTLRSQVWQAIEYVAKGIRKAEPELTHEQAICKAMEQEPKLLEGYELGVSNGEPPEFAPVSKTVEPTAVEKALDDAWAPIEKAAKALVDAGQAETFEQATVIVIDREPDLYRAYDAAERGE